MNANTLYFLGLIFFMTITTQATVNKPILLITTNKGKFEEIKRFAHQIDPEISIEQVNIELPEYQNINIKEVALGKAKHAWNVLKEPLLIDDGGIYIEKYNQFPGVFSKFVYEGIGLEGVWDLAKSDPRGYFLTCLVFVDSKGEHHFFEGKCHGTFIQPTQEEILQQLPYQSIFRPAGYTQTLAQLRATKEEVHYHHRFRAVNNFLEWLKLQK
jgi:non-canonical purine NTP pyrophosphatase (RdgB/HAM1 family)